MITIRVGRDTDIEAARELALQVVKENGAKEKKAIAGCFLTKVEATAMTLELRLRANDSAHRDALRSNLLRGTLRTVHSPMRIWVRSAREAATLP